MKATINTSPADRALTASDRYVFAKPDERRAIVAAKRRFFASGGYVTVYAAGTSLPVGRYRDWFAPGVGTLERIPVA